MRPQWRGRNSALASLSVIRSVTAVLVAASAVSRPDCLRRRSAAPSGVDVSMAKLTDATAERSCIDLFGKGVRDRREVRRRFDFHVDGRAGAARGGRHLPGTVVPELTPVGGSARDTPLGILVQRTLARWCRRRRVLAYLGQRSRARLVRMTRGRRSTTWRRKPSRTSELIAAALAVMAVCAPPTSRCDVDSIAPFRGPVGGRPGGPVRPGRVRDAVGCGQDPGEPTGDILGICPGESPTSIADAAQLYLPINRWGGISGFTLSSTSV